MRKLFQSMLLLAALSMSVPVTAATANDFYMGLLRRGAADVEAGRFNDALTPLRLAAFGLVETIDQYETALAYLTIALDRTGDAPRTRDALQRILAAERVQRKFGTLSLPPSIRTSFDTVARKVLTSAEVASLSATSIPPPTTTAAPTRPVTETPSRAVTEPPKPVTTQPATKAPVVAEAKPPVLKPPPPPPPPATQQQQQQSSAQTQQQTQPKPQQQAPRIDVPARLVAAERALNATNLVEAKRIYRELLDAPGVDHATWIRIAEGLYRSRDFAGTLTAFQRVGTLRPGEEAYRYYIAVALYETGQFERAKRELASALPHIEATADVERYRVKIESAR